MTGNGVVPPSEPAPDASERPKVAFGRIAERRGVMVPRPVSPPKTPASPPANKK